MEACLLPRELPRRPPALAGFLAHVFRAMGIPTNLSGLHELSKGTQSRMANRCPSQSDRASNLGMVLATPRRQTARLTHFFVYLKIRI